MIVGISLHLSREVDFCGSKKTEGEEVRNERDNHRLIQQDAPWQGSEK